MAPRGGIGAGTDAAYPEYAGQYRLESCLGSGGMGVVHLARSGSGLPLAVKVVHAELAEDPEFRGRFRQEIAAARRVSGAFTAPVVDADAESVRPWMATLYIPGPTLSEQVKRHGPLSPAQLRRLMAGLAEALRDIHRAGVVHRDLKPSNVLLADDGPKVIDFGISRPKDSELRTETGKLIGSPPFMAPEQFRRPREVGPAADMFALGSLLVHAATGKAPFESDSPYLVAYQVVHNEADLSALPEALVPLVEACLSKNPEDRPTADEVMADLRSVAASYETQAFIPAQRKVRQGDAGGGAGWAAVPNGPMEQGSSAESAGAEGAAGPAGPRTSGESARSGNLAAPADPTDPARSPTPRTSRFFRRPLVLGALAAALALCAAGTALLWPGGDGGTVPGGRPSGAPKAAFSPWREDLPGGSAQASGGTPRCAYTERALYCAQPGLPAAALDPGSGKLAWSREAAPKGAPEFAPQPAAGRLLTVSDDGGTLLALDPADGKKRWQRELGSYGGAVRFAGETVLLGGRDGSLTGLDAASGEQRWRRPGGAGQPVLWAFGESVLATRLGGDGGSTLVTSLDPDSGRTRWEHRFAGAVRPAGVAGRAVVLQSLNSAAQTEALIRYAPGRGTQRRIPLKLPLDDALGAVHGDRAYLTAAGGAVVAVDLVAGEQRWRTESGASRGSVPVTDGRRVCFSTPGGALVAVDAGDGHLLGQTKARPRASAPEQVAAAVPPPVMAGGRVYASAPDGSVFAVNSANPSVW
ncbi:serine/threonine-protein kinase [Streptomyces physcomitrii]|uniref:PQQ-binding-like beta-propeller repeat protein n=1 Tax=Streptomyces physcomitrii TaxID=2724184 RepID=A0ABX1H9A1_9ACTN|nr:serine/threonine-protein kinase [Streptomyces physcomitrii]NKI44663.1 PQQ-binding-like beta-propeller repeat protein [Streptomyces physcomitrii]